MYCNFILKYRFMGTMGVNVSSNYTYRNILQTTFDEVIVEQGKQVKKAAVYNGDEKLTRHGNRHIQLRKYTHAFFFQISTAISRIKNSFKFIIN